MVTSWRNVGIDGPADTIFYGAAFHIHIVHKANEEHVEKGKQSCTSQVIIA